MHAPWLFHPLVIFKPKHFRLISRAETERKRDRDKAHACVYVRAHVCMHVSASVHVSVTFVSLKQAHSVIAPKVTFIVLSVSKVMPVAALLFL